MASTFNKMDFGDGPILQILSGLWIGADYYDLPITDTNIDMTGVRHLVIPFINYSDDLVYVNFQGKNANGEVYYLRPDQDVWLVDGDGFAERLSAVTRMHIILPK